MSEVVSDRGSRFMAKRALAVAAVTLGAAGALLVAAGALSFRAQQAGLARARHTAQGETRLVVVNPAGAAVALHRAGVTLDDAEPVAFQVGEGWFPEGRYFLTGSLGPLRLFFPFTVDGSGEGPEDDGSWTVTVRSPSPESPPVLEGGLPFVFVPGGHFTMGDRNNPGQTHAVWVASFHLAVFEVTNGEFRRFLADPEGYADRANWNAAGWAWKENGASQATARLVPSDPRYSRFGRDDLPVMLVTWHEASAFCRWLTRRLGAGRWLFRMPTEAEWEKAARGPDGFDYGLGMELSEPQAPSYNWKKNPGAAVTLVGREDTVRDYRPNRYGIYHASGNAREWTQSVFRHYNREHPYREDGTSDDEAAGMRVTRGGSWYSASSVRLHLAYREEFQPELSSDDLGFRVAALLGPVPAGEGDPSRPAGSESGR
jgi:formylglycine-generating enzyme required for sulfatase activity